jgi:two-component system sensor histidine kinase KdpD
VNRRGRPGREGSNGLEPGASVDPAPGTTTRPGRELWRRRAAGTAATLASLGISAAVLAPFRPSLSVATTGLVLVVPVVVGVAIGGFFVGVAAVALGFVLWDYLFIPPYRTLAVTQAQDWVALAVYAVVMLVVARVVANLEAARALARARERSTRQLFELSEVLLRDRPVEELLRGLASSVRAVFGVEASVVGERESSLGGPTATSPERLDAGDSPGHPDAAGRPERRSSPTRSELASGRAVAVRGVDERGRALRTVPLAVAGRPVALLVVEGRALDRAEEELLGVFANHTALALERAELRGQAMRTELLEEVDRWRQTLVSTVSHDLRTPLASIKAAVSGLRDPALGLEPADRAELLETVELQADRLSRMVASLLDLSRLESGALRLDRQPLVVDELVTEAVASLGTALRPDRVRCALAEDLPAIEGDHTLLCEVLANLLENAARHGPEETPIEVRARPGGVGVEITVTDRGPGVAAEDREGIFRVFDRRAGGGRAGLGLAIVKAFVDAHGGTLGVSSGPDGGAAFTFSVPASELPVEAV